MPEPITATVATGITIHTIVLEALKGSATSGASAVSGSVAKGLYNRVVSHFTSSQPAAEDPLTVAVLKTQVEVLLSFVDECRSTLQGLPGPDARSELEWLESKRDQLTALRQDIEQGAFVWPTVHAGDIRALLADDGHMSEPALSEALESLAREESGDRSICFAGHIRHEFAQIFSTRLRSEIASNASLNGLTSQILLAELPAMLAVEQRQLEVAQSQLGVTQVQLQVLEEMVSLLRQTIASLAHSSEPSARRVNNLGRRPSPLVGRHRQLDLILAHARSAVSSVCAIRGMGGAGKSALALTAAHTLAAGAADAAIYVDLQGSREKPLSIREAQATIIQSLSDYSQPLNDEDLSGLYRATLTGKSGLLVLDDIPSDPQVGLLRPPEGWTLLFTCRPLLDLGQGLSVDLGALDQLDARNLLQSIVRGLGDHLADEITGRCGRLPLAICLAGRALQNSPSISAADYIRRLSDETRLVGTLDRARVFSPDLEGVEATILTSMSLLPSPLQDRLLQLAAFPSTFGHIAAGAIWGMLPDPTPAADVQVLLDEAADTLADLVRFSTVEFESTTGRYRLHNLTRTVARALLTDSAREVTAARHADFYRWVLVGSDQRLGVHEDDLLGALTQLNQDWQNIREGWEWSIDRANQREDAAQFTVAYAAAGARLLPGRMHPKTRIDWYEPARAAASQLGEREHEANFLTILGTAYSQLGNYDQAIDLHLESRVVAQSVPDAHLDLNALGNLANVLAERGRHHKDLADIAHAEKLNLEALQAARDLDDMHIEASALLNLGQVRAELSGPHSAFPALEEALVKARSRGLRGLEILALASLGALYRMLYESVRSLEALEQAMTYLDEGLALTAGRGEMQTTLTILVNMANVYHDAGDYHYRAAIDVNEVSVSVARANASPGLLATALRNLSLAYAKADQLENAIAAAEEALPLLDAFADPRAHFLRNDVADWRAILAKRIDTTRAWLTGLQASPGQEAGT